jgi:hypothetical protein
MKEKKHISSVSKQTRYARRLREELIAQLGGKCEMRFKGPCAGELQFDHKEGRDYNPNKLSYSARMARYRREAEAGELRLLCEKHNLECRVKNDNGLIVRTEHAEWLTRTSHMNFAEQNPF